MKIFNGSLSKLSLGVIVILWLMLGLIMPAQATLIDRGLFDNGLGGTVHLVYDDDLNVTWLGDANFAQTSGFDADGALTWNEAITWADSLVLATLSNWRLPTTVQPDGGCTNQGIQNGGRVFSWG